MKRPAVFLDRDGTVIEHVHHLADPKLVQLIPGAADAIASLKRAGYVCVIVTNQSVVGRGKLTLDGLKRIHDVMHDQLAGQNVALDGVYFCPESPKQKDPTVIEHPDRKPGPGMLERAACDLDLDLSASWMIGDAISDILAGSNAGCAGSILVRTGLGMKVVSDHPSITAVAADITEAAKIIVDRIGSDSDSKLSSSNSHEERS